MIGRIAASALMFLVFCRRPRDKFPPAAYDLIVKSRQGGDASFEGKNIEKRPGKIAALSIRQPFREYGRTQGQVDISKGHEEESTEEYPKLLYVLDAGVAFKVSRRSAQRDRCTLKICWEWDKMPSCLHGDRVEISFIALNTSGGMIPVDISRTGGMVNYCTSGGFCISRRDLQAQARPSNTVRAEFPVRRYSPVNTLYAKTGEITLVVTTPRGEDFGYLEACMSYLHSAHYYNEEDGLYRGFEAESFEQGRIRAVLYRP